MHKFRFTGTLPTKLAVKRYPNWMLALDEEALPDWLDTRTRVLLATRTTAPEAGFRRAGDLPALELGLGEEISGPEQPPLR